MWGFEDLKVRPLLQLKGVQVGIFLGFLIIFLGEIGFMILKHFPFNEEG